jgi:hypothetical protein
MYLSDQYLAWSYIVVANPELWQPWMSYLNLTRVPRSPPIDGSGTAGAPGPALRRRPGTGGTSPAWRTTPSVPRPAGTSDRCR